jgi:hypothetical protein
VDPHVKEYIQTILIDVQSYIVRSWTMKEISSTLSISEINHVIENANEYL